MPQAQAADVVAITVEHGAGAAVDDVAAALCFEAARFPQLPIVVGQPVGSDAGHGAVGVVRNLGGSVWFKVGVGDDRDQPYENQQGDEAAEYFHAAVDATSLLVVLDVWVGVDHGAKCSRVP